MKTNTKIALGLVAAYALFVYARTKKNPTGAMDSHGITKSATYEEIKSSLDNKTPDNNYSAELVSYGDGVYAVVLTKHLVGGDLTKTFGITEETYERLRNDGIPVSDLLLSGTSGIGATTPTYSKQRLDTYIQSHDVRELVAQYETRNKVLCEVGDEQGGRSFYLTRKNFLYLFNFCLFKYAPIAVWTGDHWLTRNNGDKILLS